MDRLSKTFRAGCGKDRTLEPETSELELLELRTSESETVKCTTLESGTLSATETHRFTKFVNTGFEESKLKLSDSQIKEHQEEVISVVRRLCDKLGELYPVFTIGDILGNGSYFHDCKIIASDEADLLLVFKHLSGSNIKLSDVSHEGNKVKVEVCNEDVRTQINEIKQSLGASKKVTKGNTLLPSITNVLHRAIHACLSQLGGINYRGKSQVGPTSSNWDTLNKLRLLHHEGSTDFYRSITQQYCENRNDREMVDSCRNGTYDPYLPQHTIVLDKKMHGPCVRLRLGCEKYTTDIDLGFSIDHQRTVDGTCRYLVLPHLPLFTDQPGWTQSLYNNNNTIDTHHNKLFMVLKFLILECQLVPDSSTYSSHALKTLVLRHQAACTPSERSLGGCLCDVAHRVFELYEMKEEDGDLWIYDSDMELCDMDYSDVDVKPKVGMSTLPNYWMMPVVFYITIRALRSAYCTGEQVLHVDRWLVLSELWNNKGKDGKGGYVQLSGNFFDYNQMCKIPIEKIDQLITRYYRK